MVFSGAVVKVMMGETGIGKMEKERERERKRERERERGISNTCTCADKHEGTKNLQHKVVI